MQTIPLTQGKIGPNTKVLIGLRFGSLVVVGLAGYRVCPTKKRRPLWKCVCDCGKEIAVLGNSLSTGNTRSCGCLYRATRTTANFKHGQCPIEGKTTTYQTWDAMIQRCTNPKNEAWKNYGGRGIKVCDRWLNSFAAFLEDMGERPAGLTIDRRDDNGNYEPRNCRWGNKIMQNNNRRDCRKITHDGRTQTVAQWARELGIRETTIRGRLQRGWKGPLLLAKP